MRRIATSMFSLAILGGMFTVGCQSNKPTSGNNDIGASPSHDTDYNSRLGGNQTNNMGQAAPTTNGSNTTR